MKKADRMKTPFLDFDYAAARADFSHSVPEFFNFAFDVVDRRAQDNDKLALIAIDRSGQNVTHYRYSDLERESNRFANALLALGVRKGDSVLVVLPRMAQWYFVLLGCTKIGAIAMPGTNQLKAKDLAYRIQRSGASVVVVGPAHAQAVESIASDCSAPITTGSNPRREGDPDNKADKNGIQSANGIPAPTDFAAASTSKVTKGKSSERTELFCSHHNRCRSAVSTSFLQRYRTLACPTHNTLCTTRINVCAKPISRTRANMTSCS